MKHLKPNSKCMKLPIRAEEKGAVMADPCLGLSGKDLKKCEKQH